MRDGSTGKLIASAFIFFVALSSSVLWLQSDVVSGDSLRVVSKLLLANFLACSAAAFLGIKLLRRWRAAADRLESFTAALPPPKSRFLRISRLS